MRISRTAFVVSLLLLLWRSICQAQPSSVWPPPPPSFKFDSSYLAADREWYKGTPSFFGLHERRDSPIPADQLWQQAPGLGDKAFELLRPASQFPLNGTWVLAPGQSDVQGETYIDLNLKRIKDGQLSSYFYIYRKAVMRWHSPQMSPDGRNILIREGLPPDDRANGYLVWIWDLDEGNLRVMRNTVFQLTQLQKANPNLPFSLYPKDIYFPQLLWSPGSRFVSYLRGGIRMATILPPLASSTKTSIATICTVWTCLRDQTA